MNHARNESVRYTKRLPTKTKETACIVSNLMGISVMRNYARYCANEPTERPTYYIKQHEEYEQIDEGHYHSGKQSR